MRKKYSEIFLNSPSVILRTERKQNSRKGSFLKSVELEICRVHCESRRTFSSNFRRQSLPFWECIKGGKQTYGGATWQPQRTWDSGHSYTTQRKSLPSAHHGRETTHFLFMCDNTFRGNQFLDQANWHLGESKPSGRMMAT